MSSPQSKTKVIARWIAFIPAAIASFWVVLALNRMWLLFIMSDSIFRSFAAEALPNLVAGGVMVGVGRYVAPSHKNQAGWLLFGMVCMLIGAGLFAQIMLQRWEWTQWVAITSLLIGVGTGAWTMQRESSE